MPLQGAWRLFVRLPRALPWAMETLGFQPVFAHTSLVSRLCAHVIGFTSLRTRHWFHIFAHTSLVSRFCAHVIGFTSLGIRYWFHIFAHTLLVSHLCAYVIGFTSLRIRYWFHIFAHTLLCKCYWFPLPTSYIPILVSLSLLVVIVISCASRRDNSSTAQGNALGMK